ncbi:MAG: hypothetical protein ACRC1M_07125 [Methanobacteriaceae archaeon]
MDKDDVKKEIGNSEELSKKNKNYKSEIILGYILSFFLGIFGFIIGLHLITREDKKARKHGLIILIIGVLFLTVGIFSASYSTGFSVGYDSGQYDGSKTGYRVGYNVGYDAGFIDGWNSDYYKGTGKLVGNKIYSNPYRFNAYMSNHSSYYIDFMNDVAAHKAII